MKRSELKKLILECLREVSKESPLNECCVGMTGIKSPQVIGMSSNGPAPIKSDLDEVINKLSYIDDAKNKISFEDFHPKIQDKLKEFLPHIETDEVSVIKYGDDTAFVNTVAGAYKLHLHTGGMKKGQVEVTDKDNKPVDIKKTIKI